jgi:uncharacterized membrane protein YfcA
MLKLISIGIISGILTGITGVQAAVLVPLLLLIIPDIKTAIGTTLYVFLPPTAILSVYYLYKKNHVDVYKGNVLIGVLLFSILVGSMISVHVSRKTIMGIQALTFMGLSIFYSILYLKYNFSS